MALKQSKKISELESLDSASLNTTIVGVDNGVTYKIEMDVLADSVKDRINTIDIIRLNNLELATGSYLSSLDGAISSSSQLTASFDSLYVKSGSIAQTTWDNILNKPNGIVSQSVDLFNLNSFTQSQDILNTAFTNGMNARLQTSSFNDFSASVNSRIIAATNEQSFNGLISSSVQISNLGFISQSTNLTSLNTFTQSINSRVGNLENTTSSYLTSLNGAITSSAQITAFGFISSSNTDITLLNSFTSSQSILNTAFNNGILARLQTSSFNDFSSSVHTEILAATNDGLATTGSNTFTGTNTFKGISRFETVGNDEGGEIEFGIPATNTTLQNRVTIDVWRDKLRFFEGSTNAKGVHIDLSKAPGGASGELLWKASGLVNVGTFVTLDNVKATATRTGAGGGFAGLSIGAVSTTFVADISATYSNNSMGGSTATNVTYTTTASNAAFGWGFGQGNQSTYILNDTTNSRVYRITLMVGASYNNNFVLIERLF